jgi:hypothetical protein
MLFEVRHKEIGLALVDMDRVVMDPTISMHHLEERIAQVEFTNMPAFIRKIP